MRKLGMAAVGSVLALGLTACGGNDKSAEKNVTNTTVTTNSAAGTMGAPGDTGMAGGVGSAGGAGAATGSAWPEGARIVEEKGVTYRVDSTGARVRLEPNTSRVVVEKGVRYRVDPGGTRVRIDDRGAAVRVGDSVIKGNAPNGRSDVETPGEAVTDAGEDAVEAIGDAIPD